MYSEALKQIREAKEGDKGRVTAAGKPPSRRGRKLTAEQKRAFYERITGQGPAAAIAENDEGIS